jgi:hypothetical protein
MIVFAVAAGAGLGIAIVAGAVWILELLKTVPPAWLDGRLATRVLPVSLRYGLRSWLERSRKGESAQQG